MAATYEDRIGGAQSSLAIKAPVVAATTANITLSGLKTVDGVVLTAGDRVLVQAQTNAIMNGIWIASALEWTRAKDFNGARDVARGTFVLASGGVISANSVFILTTANPVIGSSELAFTRQFVTSAAAEAWAQSASPPDPEDPTSKSAKAWAELAEVSATLAVDAQENLFDAWRGSWGTATAYIVGDLAREDGTTYICLVAHTSGTFVTDLGAGRWAAFAVKGDAGAGTGDVVAANNGSEFNAAAFKATLGFGAAASLNTSDDPDFAGVAPTSLAPRAAIDAFVDAAVAAIPPATTDYELISRTVISGSPAAVDFVFDPNLYDTIVFHIGNILHNAVGVQLFMRFSSDGGASFDSGSGNYAGAFSSSNAIVLSGAGEAAVYQPYSAELRLHNPVSASQRTQLTGSIVYSDTNTSTVVATNSISAARLAATQTNAARFYWGTGLFSNVGVITCYGVRNS